MKSENDRKVAAVVVLARDIVAQKKVHIPIEQQLQALAKTVVFLTESKNDPHPD